MYSVFVHSGGLSAPWETGRMNIREFYQTTGGDYTDALQRLMKESRVEKFTRMFPDDSCYRDLESSLAEKDVAGAFRAVHTLKGVCLNLSYTRLYEAVFEVTEALRNADPDNEEDMANVEACMEPLRSSYRQIIEAARSLDS